MFKKFILYPGSDLDQSQNQNHSCLGHTHLHIKFHENQSKRFWVILLNVKKIAYSMLEKSKNLFCIQARIWIIPTIIPGTPTYPQNFMKSIHNFWVIMYTDRQTNKQTNRQTNESENITSFFGRGN